MASIVLFFVYVMFFIPKMDLISLGGGFNAGLRVDDLIICLLFFFFFLYAAQNKKTKVREGANKFLIWGCHIHPERIPEGHHEPSTHLRR